MVPWRVAQGERLYRDVHFHHGPLSAWLGAACDRAFGRSLTARSALAGVLALLHIAALGSLARRCAAPWRAALGTSVAVAVAVFLRPGGWMFPFSFDCAIAVAALTGAVAASEKRRSSADGLAGFCLLAALLARVELGLAGVAIVALATRREPIRLLRLAFFPVASAAAAYAVLSYGIPVPQLVSDGWLCVLHPPEAFRNVYRAYAGLDRIDLRLAELALVGVVLVLAAALVCLAAAVSSRLSAASATIVEGSAGAVLFGAAAVCVWPPASLAATLSLLPPLVRAIPPVIAVAAGWRLLLGLLRREPRGSLSRVPDAVLWLAGLFAVRVLLAAGYGGPYGSFFLPLPTMLGVVALLALADRAAPAIGYRLPQLTTAALLVFLLSRSLGTAVFYRRPGWGLVRTPAGGLWLPEPVAATTQAALGALSARLPLGGSLTGFPEAGFFDYVLGLRNPFWTEQFFPGHLDAAGEDRAISLLGSRPPDVLLYANVLAVGEGQRAFGTDYLRRLDAAARAVSSAAAIYGAPPGARIGDPAFFVELRVPVGAPR